MEIFKKLTVVLTIFILLNFLIFKLVKADDCPSDLSERITCLEKKISATKNQGKTLSSEINLLDEKISLTRSQINLTQQQLGRLTDDISSVSGKIGFIEDSLAVTSNILANRIAKTYIAGRTDPMVYLLTAADFSNFWQRLEYLRLVQKHDRQLLLQMATTRKNYRDQKDLLTDKKKQIEKLSTQLKAYKVTLDKQNREKQQLLIDTKDSESEYQRLLSQARAKLLAFTAFSNFAGGGVLSNQTVCNDGWKGCYYNQRDSKWANNLLPGSGFSFATAGCLATSMAMIYSHYGYLITPSDLANTLAAFIFGDLRYPIINVNGVNSNRQPHDGFNQNLVDSELSSGRPVILQLAMPSISGEHFIVLISGSNGKYKMNDPIRENGHNIDFSQYYSTGMVITTDIVSI